MTDETAPVPETPEPQPDPEPEDPRTIITRILDKAHALLLGEPARLIGYGAAVIVFLVAQFLASRGYVKFEGLSFDESVGLTLSVITFVILIIESIRRFVYSPATFMQEVIASWEAGHKEAHDEERLHALLTEVVAKKRSQQVIVPVAPAPPDDGLPN